MDVNDPRWDAYEARFRELAEDALLVQGDKPALDRTQAFLCLYGENGLSPEDEFAVLDQLAAAPPEQRRRIEVTTEYWQDTVLFLP